MGPQHTGRTGSAMLGLLGLLAIGCPGPVEDTGDGPVDRIAEAPLRDQPAVGDIAWRLHDTLETLVYVSWEQRLPGVAWVEYQVDPEGEWMRSPAQHLGTGPAEHLLLGIPYDTSFTFRIVNDLGLGPMATEEQVGTTAAHPELLPLPALGTVNPGDWDPTGKWLLMSVNEVQGGWTGGPFWLVILDRQGRVVWAQVAPVRNWTIYARVSLDGDDILWDEFTYWSSFDDGAASMVHRMKIDGTIVETYPTPGGHHAFTELPDGSIAWGAALAGDETLEVLDTEGNQRTVWRCSEWQHDVGMEGFCQSNALYYHEPEDTFLYSFYTSSTVVEIENLTGTTRRSWGHAPGSWVFDPPESLFHWQHGVTITDEGSLLLTTHTTQTTSELVSREYVLDPEAETLHQIWNFGIGEGIRGETAGEAHRLPSGNTLVNYGSGGRVREVTHAGGVVWEIYWDPRRLIGRSVWLDDLYDFAP